MTSSNEAKKRIAPSPYEWGRREGTAPSYPIPLKEPGKPGQRPRGVAETAAQEAATLEGKLVGLRELGAHGLISPATLARLEEQGARDLVALREASSGAAIDHTMGAKMERTERVALYEAAGCDPTTAGMLADGRNPRTDSELSARIDVIEGRQLRADYERGIRLGFSEAGAIEYARGRSSTTPSQVRRLMEAAGGSDVGLSDEEAELEQIEKRLAESFAREDGMSDAAARIAARGRE